MAEKDDKAEEGVKKTGPGLLSVLPLAVIASAATFGMVWMAASPQESVDMPMCETHAEEEQISYEEIEARAATYVELEPVTVSLPPETGARHLRISIALGVPPDGVPITDSQFLRLRDRFIERLRHVDTSLISDPDQMPALKDELLLQAHSTLGKDAVYTVLITDFLMK